MVVIYPCYYTLCDLKIIESSSIQGDIFVYMKKSMRKKKTMQKSKKDGSQRPCTVKKNLWFKAEKI